MWLYKWTAVLEVQPFKKRRLFCCVWSQHKDNSISCLFLCPYKCGKDPNNFKWLIDLPRKGIFYLMGKGKHSILRLSLQRFRMSDDKTSHCWECLYVTFIMSFSIIYHSLWSLFKGLKVPSRVLALWKYSTLVWCSVAQWCTLSMYEIQHWTFDLCSALWVSGASCEMAGLFRTAVSVCCCWSCYLWGAKFVNFRDEVWLNNIWQSYLL